jgi:hypothetical protein
MKPDWSTAPAWARYLAQYDDGRWFWFQNKPDAGLYWWWVRGGEYCRADISNWHDTLEERPVHNEAEGRKE